MAVSTVHDIWKKHGLAPHRWRSFKLSDDPAFVEKLHAIVSRYVSPNAHAVVLSIHEKSEIQALDRTQTGANSHLSAVHLQLISPKAVAVAIVPDEARGIRGSLARSQPQCRSDPFLEILHAPLMPPRERA
jgi:hypothetical protein